MTMCGPEVFGADPVNIKWSVVRGDTATLRVEFLEDDEVSYFDTTDWSYKVSVYSPREDVVDELDIDSHNGYIDVTAPATLTSEWGGTLRSAGAIAELLFDVEVRFGDTVWTPVLGTIIVLGDLTYGGL